MSRDREFIKGVLFIALFTFILLGVDFYNKNTELVLSLLGKETPFMSNALTLDEFRETQGWGIENIQLLEDQSGIKYTINDGGKDIYKPDNTWYTSIGVRTYGMKLSLRTQIDREPLILLPHSPVLYSLPMGEDRLGIGTRQAVTKFRVDGEDCYWVMLYNVNHKQKISDFESRILINKK